MFVLRSTYERDLARANIEALTYKSNFNSLISKWNDLVHRVNARGGEAFLSGNVTAPKQLEDKDIQKLLMLCHPDKHGGKPMAEEMTKKLLALRL